MSSAALIRDLRERAAKLAAWTGRSVKLDARRMNDAADALEAAESALAAVRAYLDAGYHYRHGDSPCTAACVPIILSDVRAALAAKSPAADERCQYCGEPGCPGVTCDGANGSAPKPPAATKP